MYRYTHPLNPKYSEAVNNKVIKLFERTQQSFKSIAELTFENFTALIDEISGIVCQGIEPTFRDRPSASFMFDYSLLAGLHYNGKNDTILKARTFAACGFTAKACQLNELENTITANYDLIRSVSLPIFYHFAKPKYIWRDLQQLLSELKNDFDNHKSLFYIAAKVHCRFIAIQPCSHLNKTIARILMNCFLVINEKQPIVQEAWIEVDAYYSATFETLCHAQASHVEISKYAHNAFEIFIKNKVTMTSRDYVTWLIEHYKFSSNERSYQLALNCYKTPENLLKAIEVFRLNQNPYPYFIEQLNYAKRRLLHSETCLTIDSDKDTFFVILSIKGKLDIFKTEPLVPAGFINLPPIVKENAIKRVSSNSFDSNLAVHGFSPSPN